MRAMRWPPEKGGHGGRPASAWRRGAAFWRDPHSVGLTKRSSAASAASPLQRPVRLRWQENPERPCPGARWRVPVSLPRRGERSPLEREPRGAGRRGGSWGRADAETGGRLTTAGLRHRAGSGTWVRGGRNVRAGATRARVGRPRRRTRWGACWERPPSTRGRGRACGKAGVNLNWNEGDALPATEWRSRGSSRERVAPGSRLLEGSAQRGPNETKLSGERSESAAAPR